MGEADEAKIIFIKISSFLKSIGLRQSSSDMILRRRRDLSGSRQKGLMSKVFGSEVLSACSRPF